MYRFLRVTVPKYAPMCLYTILVIVTFLCLPEILTATGIIFAFIVAAIIVLIVLIIAAIIIVLFGIQAILALFFTIVINKGDDGQKPCMHLVIYRYALACSFGSRYLEIFT